MLQKAQAGVLVDNPNVGGDEEKGVVIEREENVGAVPEINTERESRMIGEPERVEKMCGSMLELLKHH